ncbi:FosX/FosE/FosI family fosfomycin resistance hydrolase [Tumidithrix elongata RA019]|uniref:FosX/FosE/FosI family fosfomycin resistance hydrolase n=1 Tax=Tumidithrix elongata BACA0141 TaxID=2716417 RepID=A0AAW9PZ73_9CYAN|nr:FosX/FosE/FosI family fosfomycin resistance hydrolase [Tumidithrix elongata RA019]
MIEGLSHITFVVSDLERTSIFLSTIFEAKEVYSSEDKTFSIAREKFFLINGIWIAVMEGKPLSEKTYNHVAFKISDRDFEKYLLRIKSLDLEVRESRSRIEGEGNSLYFYDYDNHLFELHTGTLDRRLAAYSCSAKHSRAL